MADQEKNMMQCAEFERTLSDALDEKLDAQTLAGFQTHARSCSVCGPLLTGADAGRRWLKSLEDVEPSAHLIENILVATSGLDTSRLGAARRVRSQVTWVERFRDGQDPSSRLRLRSHGSHVSPCRLAWHSSRYQFRLVLRA